MKKRILVADDNPLIRKMLCKIFSDHKALEICDEALNGQEAVEKAERLRPDLDVYKRQASNHSNNPGILQ